MSSSKYRKDGSLYPACDPGIPHPGKVFYGGRWVAPEVTKKRYELGRYRKDGTLFPCFDPNIPHPGRLFYGGYWQTSEQHQKGLEATRKWRQENQEHVREVQRKRRQENPEKVREAQRKWVENNPEKVRANNRNQIASGRKALRNRVNRRKALEAGKCGSCLGRPAVSGFTQCEVCKKDFADWGRLKRRYGLPRAIIRELGLDKNLPAPRREHADR